MKIKMKKGVVLYFSKVEFTKDHYFVIKNNQNTEEKSIPISISGIINNDTKIAIKETLKSIIYSFFEENDMKDYNYKIIFNKEMYVNVDSNMAELVHPINDYEIKVVFEIVSFL